VIGRRLNRLSERCNEVLTIAAVIGREFTLAQLGRLVRGSPRIGCWRCWRRAGGAGDRGTAAHHGRYQFTHALTRRRWRGALVDAAGAAACAYRAGAGGAVRCGGGGARAELAYHYGQAEAVLGAEKLIKYSLLAGERALASYAMRRRWATSSGAGDQAGQPIDGQGPTYSLAKEGLRLRWRCPSHHKPSHNCLRLLAHIGDVQRAAAVASFSS